MTLEWLLPVLLAACQTTATRPAETAVAPAQTLHVLTSGGFTSAFKALSTHYEHVAGGKVVAGYGPSMGDTPNAIPQRLARH